ncbi:MAG: VWA domain-containing protein, partial [Deltaproteobacteria bacterium]
RAVDAEMYGEPRTRLDLAREVVTRFALHRVAAGDRVGLVVFGGRAYTQLPLTTDGRLLESALARIAPAGPNEPTALGDGLALAVRRVSAGSAGPTATAEPLAGRLVVLLTDGRNNAGAIPIDVAAGIAIAKRIRVHTVGIGAERGSGGGPPAADADGGRPTDLDADTLERVAELTRGRFFHARSTRDLGAVYAEIDALERVPRATPDPIRTTPRPEGLLLAAGTLLLVEIAAARVLLRRIP